MARATRAVCRYDQSSLVGYSKLEQTAESDVTPRFSFARQITRQV